MNELTAVATDSLGSRSTSTVVRVTFVPTPMNSLSANLLASGQLRLCFLGTVNSSYVLDSAIGSASAPNWRPLSTNTAPASTSGLITFSDSMFPVQRARFYRMRQHPYDFLRLMSQSMSEWMFRPMFVML
jgi:hypothetical protein